MAETIWLSEKAYAHVTDAVGLFWQCATQAVEHPVELALIRASRAGFRTCDRTSRPASAFRAPAPVSATLYTFGAFR